MDLYKKVVSWLVECLLTAGQLAYIRPSDIRRAAFGDSTLSRRQARKAARAQGREVGLVWKDIVSDRFSGALLAKGYEFIKSMTPTWVLEGRTEFWMECLAEQKKATGFSLNDLHIAEQHLVDYAHEEANAIELTRIERGIQEMAAEAICAELGLAEPVKA